MNQFLSSTSRTGKTNASKPRLRPGDTIFHSNYGFGTFEFSVDQHKIYVDFGDTEESVLASRVFKTTPGDSQNER